MEIYIAIGHEHLIKTGVAHRIYKGEDPSQTREGVQIRKAPPPVSQEIGGGDVLEEPNLSRVVVSVTLVSHAHKIS